MKNRYALRAGAAIAATVLALSASAASAHIHVDSDDAVAGGETGKVIFRVPTESDTASTTKIEVQLPAKTPFADVTTETKPGWSVKLTEKTHDTPIKIGEFTVTKTVSAITWTADKDSAIPPRQFTEFTISVGPLPDKAGTTLEFPATQTYSDGEVVKWDEPEPKSGEEPENPIPALTLASPSADGAASEEPAGDSDTTARSLGVLGILLGLAGVVGVALSARRNRNS